MTAIRGIGDVNENVDRFLAQVGLTRSDVERLYDPTLGEVALLAIGGSVPAGYGTPSSDLDLHAVTESAGVFTNSVAHESGQLIDIVSETRSDLTSKLDSLEEWATRPLSTTPAPRLKERQLTIWLVCRLSLAAVLKADVALERAIRSRAPAIVSASRCYWSERAWQMLYLGELVSSLAWHQSIACGTEALLSGLKAVASEHGYVYPKREFLSLELEQLDETGLLARYRHALRAPSCAAEAKGWLADVRASLEDLFGPQPTGRAGLTWTPGVVVRPLRGDSIVTMWDLHGVRLGGDVPPVGEMVWTGSLGSDLDPGLLQLLSLGLVHMEVVLDA